MLFNKIDAFSYIPKKEDDLTPATKKNLSLADLKRTWMATGKDYVTVFISAKTKDNIEEFKSVLYDEVKKIHAIRYPYNDYLY